jgi:hypothetical protein
MSEKELCFTAVLRVEPDDIRLLKRSACQWNSALSKNLTVEDALRVLCVNPSEAPGTVGYQVADVAVSASGSDDAGYNVELVVKGRLLNEALFLAEAKDVYYENWGDEYWEPKGMDEAFYELVLASNASPTTSDVGYSIVSWTPGQKEAA